MQTMHVIKDESLWLSPSSGVFCVRSDVNWKIGSDIHMYFTVNRGTLVLNRT